MEDYQIDIMIDSGPNARSVQIKINVPAEAKKYLETKKIRSGHNL